MKVEKCCYPTRNSRLGRSLRRARKFGNELQASAAGKLRSTAPCGRNFNISYGIEPRIKPAAERTGLLSSGARLQPSARGRLRAAAPFGRNSEFKIQDSKLPIRGAACGGHARSGPLGRELRASAAPRLRPARSWRTVLRHRFHPRLSRSRADGPAFERREPTALSRKPA